MKLKKLALAWLFICSHDPRRLSFIWPTTIVITNLYCSSEKDVSRPESEAFPTTL